MHQLEPTQYTPVPTKHHDCGVYYTRKYYVRRCNGLSQRYHITTPRRLLFALHGSYTVEIQLRLSIMPRAGGRVNSAVFIEQRMRVRRSSICLELAFVFRSVCSRRYTTTKLFALFQLCPQLKVIQLFVQCVAISFHRGSVSFLVRRPPHDMLPGQKPRWDAYRA